MPIKQKTEGTASTGALIFGLIALAFGFAAGYVAGEKNALKARQAAPLGDSRAANARDSSLLGAAQGEQLSVNGTVNAVTGDTLLLDSRTADGMPITYRVRLTAATEIAVSKNLTTEEFDMAQKKFMADQKAYAARGSNGDAPPSPPEPFRIVNGSAADLKVGQHVSVTSSAPIAGDAFEAAAVTVTSEPATTPDVPPLPADSKE